jgi:hypothetical protein
VGEVTLLKDGQVLQDRSGVNVQVRGTDISTLTDSNGAWELNGLPTRTYDITFSKEGFGEYKDFAFPFVAGGINKYRLNIILSKIPNCVPVMDSVFSTENRIKIYSHLPCATPETDAYVAYYFGRTPDVSSAPGTHFFVRVAGGTGDQRLEGQLVSSFWRDNGPFVGLTKADTIYVIAYALGANHGTIDPLTREVIFASISPIASNVLSFQWPY